MIKAVAGGGGRGMRIAHNDVSLRARNITSPAAKRKRPSATARVYIEKYIENPRHIEFQILADHTARSSTSASATAPCSGAIRKLIEESPSPLLNARPAQEDGQGRRRSRRSSRL